jgi:hypothetical protein
MCVGAKKIRDEDFLRTSCQISVLGSQLLVSESFDGIQLCGFNGGQHAADYAHET